MRTTHWLTPDGTVACNPRDPEAAHRAAQGKLNVVVGSATPPGATITCRKCRAAYYRHLRGNTNSQRRNAG